MRNCGRWRIACALAVFTLVGIAAPAQVGFDTSGASYLAGDYFIRELMLSNVDPNTSAVGRALSLTGVISFDGQGSYSFTGQQMDTKAGQPLNITAQTGQYAVAANGFVAIQDVIDTTQTNFGAIGLFGSAGLPSLVASATEGSQKNILVAIPAGSNLTNASVKGTYSVGFIDFLQGNASLVRDGYFTLSSSGDGDFGNVTVMGAMANLNSANTTQSLPNVTYNITNAEGSGVISFPALPSLSTLVTGQKIFYISSDGSILLAGDPAGFDLMVGITALSSAATNSLYQGTYFLAGLENDTSNLASGQNAIDAFSGSIFALGQGTATSHLRYATFDNSAIDYTYQPMPYAVAADGAFTDGLIRGILGDGGAALLEVGTGSFYSLTPGLGLMWSGQQNPFLDPLKVWNAASFAPITNAVAPGEFVSLFGTGLSTATQAAASLPLPTTLAGVQVSVNGVLAPISYVSPTQINVLVPYQTSGGYAQFQVSNASGVSNPVTLYEFDTAPGVFTSEQGFAPGVGPAAALHADYSFVSLQNPARIGETLQLYVTGLGAVTPPVADGAAGAVNPLSIVIASVGVFVGEQNASVTFQGLAPGFAGVYQVNFVVPPGVPSGQVILSVSTPGALTSEAKLYVQ
jgi:uncharacterized protein (TIGR03437 family)